MNMLYDCVCDFIYVIIYIGVAVCVSVMFNLPQIVAIIVVLARHWDPTACDKPLYEIYHMKESTRKHYHQNIHENINHVTCHIHITHPYYQNIINIVFITVHQIYIYPNAYDA